MSIFRTSSSETYTTVDRQEVSITIDHLYVFDQFKGFEGSFSVKSISSGVEVVSFVGSMVITTSPGGSVFRSIRVSDNLGFNRGVDKADWNQVKEKVI